jgi:hypothetical protein
VIRNISTCIVAVTFCGLLQAAIIDTNNPATISAFQSGATVINFESISGRTAQSITSYASGNPV